MNHEFYVGCLVNLKFKDPNNVGMIIDAPTANVHELYNIDINVFYVFVDSKIIGPLFINEFTVI